VTTDLLDILITPEKLPALSASRQSQVVRQARHEALLGYLDARIDTSRQSGKLAEHLQSARVHAEYYDRQMAWETQCAEQALVGLEGPVILLKGAAYRALDLGLAKGRLASDVDLLLPRDQLAAAEELLEEAGWAPMKADDYEQHYYRQWMHELPPLQHEDRGTIIDLHHNILPPTARFKPDAHKLLTAAEPIPGSPLYTLSPIDTVLHRCAHLFVDGDLHNSLRELVDIRGLLTLYMAQAGFNAQLLPRARELDLGVPLYYALYFCKKLLALELPADWVEDLADEAGVSRPFTCYLMEQQLLASEPSTITPIQRLSGWLLFIRSHWLRMPPLMLATHLLRQSWRRGGVKAG
jgi:Uncharacterised nucleotidyltransferase